MSYDLYRRAKLRRRALDTLLGGDAFADVVREAQEIVELILKGAMRTVGVDPPKRHDIQASVLQELDRFPPEWQEKMPILAEAVAELAAERSQAFYGDEAELIAASDLFDRQDAQSALALVDDLLAMFDRLLA